MMRNIQVYFFLQETDGFRLIFTKEFKKDLICRDLFIIMQIVKLLIYVAWIFQKKLITLQKLE